MIETFPASLTVAAILNAIGAVLFLISCIAHLIGIAKQAKADAAAEPAPLPPLAAVRFVYDFEFCGTVAELKETVNYINEQRFVLISVTQYDDTYTVFFRRMLHG